MFGDGGKGVLVDNLCANQDTLVVRFSGGHNAGHTVIRDGIKHVFSSYGSGTLQGCPTFFTQDTCISLSHIFNEKAVLEEKGIENPVLYVHPLTNVTTPYDIIANRILEIVRDEHRHGSCGAGIGQTMKRNLESPYKLYAIDFLNKRLLKEKLKQIKKYRGMHQLGSEMDEELKEMEDIFFSNLDKRLPFDFVSNIYDFWKPNIVFEGSQGVLLDMDHGVFPNVTYANTTSKNVWKHLNIKKGDTLDLYYVTRCYQTRHGNGWMSDERDIPLINNEEEINVENPWQGKFRLGEFDDNILIQAINIERLYHQENIKKETLVVSCLDQRPNFDLELETSMFNIGLMGNYSAKSGNLKNIR